METSVRKIIIRVHEETYDQIKRLAAGQGRSAADLIRQAMAACVEDPRDGLTDLAPPPRPPELA